jgi:hypothetical protein
MAIELNASQQSEKTRLLRFIPDLPEMLVMRQAYYAAGKKKAACHRQAASAGYLD